MCGGSLCLVLKLTGSAYVPIGVAGGEDARTFAPGHTNGPLGARDRIRRCGPARKWLKVERGTLGPNVINTLPAVRGGGYSMGGCGPLLSVGGRHGHNLANLVHRSVKPP